MSETTARYGFALLCALGVLAIGLGAIAEIARFNRNARSDGKMRGEDTSGNIISRRQYRFRLFSAAIWMTVLGALCIATTALWPERQSPQALEQVRRFITVVGAALSLLLLALGLLLYDVIQLARERRVQTARFYQGLAEMAREEAAQVQNRKAASAAKEVGDESHAEGSHAEDKTP